MKRIVALFFAFVSTIICSNAQNAQMQINFVDGKVMEIPVPLIDNITWSINNSEPIKPDNTPNGVTAIDLGLPSGTKWANMNIGAKSISSYGDYFAWAETKGSQEGKTNFTEKGLYRFCPWIAHTNLLAKYHRATVQEERQVTYTPKFGSEAFHL